MSNKELFNQIVKSGNPQQVIQNMAMSNPKLRNLINLLQGSKMTPKQFFYHYAQQQGINPEQFINTLK